MDVAHLRQHRVREQVFHRLAEGFLLRLRFFNLRFDYLLLRHLRHFRQGYQQPLQRRRGQGQVFLLPAQAGIEVAQGNGGVINFDIDVMQRHPAQGQRVRGGQVQRAAVFFFDRLRRRHFFTVDRHINIAQGNIVDAQAAVPQAAQPDREMKLPGGDRHPRLLITYVLQRQVTPAAAHLADIQPRHPTVRRFKYQMQAAGGAHQKPDGPQQQHEKDQYAEAYLLP